ncbi:MAG TPA: hypothetical protein VI451_21495 [Anaerolineales bacterium]|nr:hypothetical protein [Anaerolineales bacterium]
MNAQTPVLPVETPSPIPNAEAQVAATQVQQLTTQIASLEAEIHQIETEIVRPGKDIFDIIASLSGLISGGLIAGVGLYITSILRQREIQQQQEKYQKELILSQAQVIRELLPSLQSNKEQEKAAALILLAALGNPDLATQLSRLYGNVPDVLIEIASLKNVSLEERRRAAVALADQPQQRVQAIKVLQLLLLDSNDNLQERNAMIASLDSLRAVPATVTSLIELAENPHEETSKRIQALKVLQESLDETKEFREKRKVILFSILNLLKLEGEERLTVVELLRMDGFQEDTLKLLEEQVNRLDLGIAEKWGNIEAIKNLGYVKKASDLQKEFIKEWGTAAQDFIKERGEAARGLLTQIGHRFRSEKALPEETEIKKN